MRSKPLTDQQKSPAHRLLLVLTAIGEHGPISLGELTDLLPVPRTAIWRATATLRDFGWVRIRLSDKAYELTSDCDLKMASCHFAHPACDTATAELQAMRQRGIAAADAGLFITPGRFALIESTRPEAELGASLSLITDPFALAAQAAMPPEDLLRQLRAYQRMADPQEKELIRTGAHARTIMALARSQRMGQAPTPRMIPVGDEILFVAPYEVRRDHLLSF